MARPARAVLRRSLATLSGAAVAAVALAALTTAGDPHDRTARAEPASAATTANPVTPGDFTGHGFDQCLAPDQEKMDAWLQSSPFLAVGIYISGDSRACRQQPNLTPEWVHTQLARGWRLLPVTLGPQASCQPRFPRYGDDETIIPKPGTDGRYTRAREQGWAEAEKTAAVASALGIVGGSTLWYDLEGFDLNNTRCRESALAFLSAWTTKTRSLGYVSGVYSSAGSGIKMLDDVRARKHRGIALPDMIWVARWDGRANVETSYLRSDGWRGARVKQYQGGHDERWGGVTINIDRNYLDVGLGSVAEPESHCGGVRLAFGSYPAIEPGAGAEAPPRRRVKALQCLLQEQGLYAGRLDGVYRHVLRAGNAFQEDRGFPVSERWTRPNWISLLTAGTRPVLKFGSAGPEVRRVQRALNAVVDRESPLRATGVFNNPTTDAVREWQRTVGLDGTGVVGRAAWKAFAAGRR